MRPIDADALQNLLLPIATALEHEYGSLGGAVSGVMKHIDAAPTVTPEPIWISAEDRLPVRGDFVLFFYAKNCRNPTQHAKNTMAVGRYDYGMFLVEGCSVSVTHWMPLPEPPEIGGADHA